MSHKQAKRARRAHLRQEGQQENTEARRPAGRMEISEVWEERLRMAVPLRILSLYSAGGITRRDLVRAYIDMEMVGATSDRLFSEESGHLENAAFFNKTARAIAVLSYLPGGVPAFRGSYVAEELLAGIIGEQGAREHVAEALQRCFDNGPINAEPLTELSRQVFSSSNVPSVPTWNGIPAYLTEGEIQLEPADFAMALLAHCVLDSFYTNCWKRHPHPSRSEEEIASDCSSLLSQVNPDKIGSSPILSEQVGTILRETDGTRSSYVHFYQHLEAAGRLQPERIDFLFSFARSRDPLFRAIFQNLLLLAAGQQLYPAAFLLSDSKEYQDLLAMLIDWFEF